MKFFCLGGGLFGGGGVIVIGIWGDLLLKWCNVMLMLFKLLVVVRCLVVCIFEFLIIMLL